MSDDDRIQDIAIASIKRKSMDIDTWRYTRVGDIHGEVQEQIDLAVGELPIVSCFISNASWYLITTRRIVGNYYGNKLDIKPIEIQEELLGLFKTYGNFKGSGEKDTEIFTLRTSENKEVWFEYETGKASMAPIYAFHVIKL